MGRKRNNSSRKSEGERGLAKRLFSSFRITVVAIWRFLRKWFFSRSAGSLLWGLPALAVAVGLAVVGEAARSVSESELVAHYQLAAAKAERNGDPDAAALWLKKTVILQPRAPQHQFHLALAAARQGRVDQAREVMRRIAPRDDQGYPDAHFWLARDMATRKLAFTPETEAEFEHHLTAALGSKQAADEAHALLGEVYFRQQKLDQAISHFEAAADRRPELGVTLGQLYQLQGETGQAKSQLERTARHFRARTEAHPEEVEAQLTWAHCQLLLGDLVESERILKQGRERSDDPRLSQGLAVVYLVGFDRVRQTEPDDVERALVLLEEAAALAPSDRRVMERLAQFAQSDATAREQARRLLERIVAAGKPAAVAHLLLGALAAEDGDVDSAKTHFELGLELQPQMLELMNNLAWVLAHAESPDLDRALQLIEIVCAKAPDNPEVLETRGQILSKLGRWKECIVDLERARPSMPERGRVHATLALAYENIGDQELADVHRELAKELLNE